ncbi:MAG: Ppx/GppA family phosphatase [Bryobacterales bacterium]|nr:Ppx/GppA family phosphatase [Bryobacterales bacterium]
MRLAAVDIGSNSIRLEVAESGAGPVQTLFLDRTVTRLGESVFRTGVIGRDALDLTCEVLKRMARAIRRHEVTAVRAVATSAVRDARNQEEFLSRSAAALGVPVEIISGAEEARLIHLGVQSRWPQGNKRLLLIDIGGGSAELIFDRAGEVIEAFSKPLGAVRLTEMFLRQDPPSPAELQRLDDYIQEKIRPASRVAEMHPTDRVIATSATASALMCAVHRIPRSARERADRLRATTVQLRKLQRNLAASSLERRRTVTGIGPKRAEIIVAGASVLLAILQDLRLPGFTYSVAGVRDGIIADLATRGAEPSSPQLSREQKREVERLARRYGVSMPHARHVAWIARRLFDALQPVHQASPAAGIVLEAAAMLKDAGHFISDTRHHRHSYYVVLHSALPGFTERERMMAANLCRYHRRSLPSSGHTGFAALNAQEQRIVTSMTPLLRLADALDRSRKQVVRDLGIRLSAVQIEIEARALAAPELEVWAAQEAAEAFRAVFRRELNVSGVIIKAR